MRQAGPTPGTNCPVGKDVCLHSFGDRKTVRPAPTAWIGESFNKTVRPEQAIIIPIVPRETEGRVEGGIRTETSMLFAKIILYY